MILTQIFLYSQKYMSEVSIFQTGQVSNLKKKCEKQSLTLGTPIVGHPVLVGLIEK